MTVIQHFHPSSSKPGFHPKVPRPGTVPLRDEDRQYLVDHLRRSEMAGQPFLPHVLQHKITSSTALDEPVPDDVVTGGCRVTYAINGGPAESGLLVHRARTGAVNGIIPVSSLLGATLIGMRVGQRAPLLSLDGTIASVSVLGVAHPG
ncbi:hypothetical protein [Roseovarius sp. ZX-A-9]|uniref:hypothetical protein n=1 Tax=Roseovarius sp. ZX-A-9 TaxID=3014783 RepID=UPI00232D0EBC|nr:hypothetical protein [Roseovarius sp. ZX-A-9]MDX1784786.1 hypothetical protein [Roseovarius sp.]